MNIKQTSAFFAAWIIGSAPLFSFDLSKATVRSINHAFDSGTLTSEQLVGMYLERIEKYDNQGPSINALINVNPDALEVARALDEERKISGPRSPLHGIPIILKDNFNTNDMPTTGASIAFKDLRPAKEAFVVTRMREAGAIILAKSTLTELVRASLTPSIGGMAKNPYDLTRNPGQSSAGTGAALAANYAPIGTGTDNGQSVRSPASASSIYGMKTTIGLVSNAGVLPSSLSHNSSGPMARSVADLAYLLNIMAGFDPDDHITRFAIGYVESDYEKYLDPNGLKGARIGMVIQLLGDGEDHQEVNRVFAEAMDKMSELGATVFPIVIPNIFDYRGMGTDLYEAYDLLNHWFSELGPDAPYKDIDDFLANAEYDERIVPRIMQQKKFAGPEYRAEYEARLVKMMEFRKLLVGVMDKYNLDAMAYPMQKRLVTKHGMPNIERNGFLASVGMLPALDIPGGYSTPTDEAPVGIPVGIDLLGRPFDEGRLIRIAYAWEVHGWARKEAPFTP
jgi:Asp-tRNA(Asn)/Glu-tRNA(Gln) amidotransferase A subunit family amidase